MYTFGYDNADQLLGATLQDTGTSAILHKYVYGYDTAANRTSSQLDSQVNGVTPNGLNQIVSTQGGGAMQFTGTLSSPAKVTVGGNPATVSGLTYTGSANVTTGSNTVAITATNAAGSTTHGFQVTVPPAATQSYAYDPNGNLLSDGRGTYQWDAANRLVGIGYVGNTDHTLMKYDGVGRRVSIVESTSGTVTGTKNFVWTGVSMAEERDAGGGATKRFFPQGEEFVTSGVGVAYFFARDHLGSVREMTDGSGGTQARYDYDPYGVQMRVSGSGVDSDFGFTGHYFHTGSGVSLTLFREYDARLGRWLSRDPAGEAGMRVNIYQYAAGDPVSQVDRLGLDNMNFYAPGSTLSMLSDQHSTLGYSVAAHGTPDVMYDDRNLHFQDENTTKGSREITPEDLAKRIQADPKYDPSKPVTLDSCSTGGVSPSGKPNFAQRLADALHNVVIAPTRDIDFYGFMWPWNVNKVPSFSGISVVRPGVWMPFRPSN